MIGAILHGEKAYLLHILNNGHKNPGLLFCQEENRSGSWIE